MSICPRDPAPWCEGKCLEPRTPTRVTEGSLTGISCKQPSASGVSGRPSLPQRPYGRAVAAPFSYLSSLAKHAR